MSDVLPEELRALAAEAGVPAWAVDLLQDTAGIRSAGDLAYACRTNVVRDLGGGVKAQAALRRALARHPGPRGPRPLTWARAAAARVLTRLEREGSALRLGLVGAARRMTSQVDRVELVATAHEPEDLAAAFVAMPFVREVVAQDGACAHVVLDDGTEATLEVLPEDPNRYFARLIHKTGAPPHVAALQARAKEKGLTFDADGLRRDDVPLPVAWEQDVYTHLEVPYQPAELREDSVLDAPPSDLVTMADVRGLAHVHTSYGCGAFSIADMAQRAEQEGFAWMLVADRCADCWLGRVLDPELAGQKLEVEALHEDEHLELRVLLGLEVRIWQDGSINWQEFRLDGLGVDVVLASLGEAPDEDVDDITSRLVRAVSHPRVNVLCHPRAPLAAWAAEPANWAPVLDACRDHGTALEISGETHRRTELPPAGGFRRTLALGGEAHACGGRPRLLEHGHRDRRHGRGTPRRQAQGPGASDLGRHAPAREVPAEGR